MTVFVAGATGYVGSAVVAVLTARGLPTIAHIRPDSSRLTQHEDTFAALGATVDVTPWKPEAMAATLVQIEPSVVFCCIGTTAARKRAADDPSAETYDAVDFGLTALLVDACTAAAQPPRFVYVSSMGTSASAPGAYMKARWKAECAIRDSGLPYTIARPAIVSGPNRTESRFGERLGAILGDGVLGVAGLVGLRAVRDRYKSMTDVELATALVQLGLDPAGADRIFEAKELRAAAKSVAR